MKNLTDYIKEQFVDVEVANVNEAEIKSADDFKKYAENKFKKAFGDKLDEDKMNKTIDGILSKYKDDADNGDWGKLVGVLNKSL